MEIKYTFINENKVRHRREDNFTNKFHLFSETRLITT
jgi:hypothetical protein